jgi:hypothetical protein
MNTKQCKDCGGNYIIEEFRSHDCRLLIITIFDTDGNKWGSYDRINFFPLAPFPKLSDDGLQSDENGENRRRFDRTLFLALLTYRRIHSKS